MRELKYLVACTLDGFIAAPDGSFDQFALSGPHLDALIAEFPETIPTHLRAALGVSGPNRHFDTVLMGRRTYEVGSKAGIASPYAHLRQLVFSESMSESSDPAIELVSGSAAERVKALKREPGKDIWLCGGGALAAWLGEEIDELILKLNPLLLGSGIPLFAGSIRPRRLQLADSAVYANGVAVMRYR